MGSRERHRPHLLQRLGASITVARLYLVHSFFLVLLLRPVENPGEAPLLEDLIAEKGVLPRGPRRVERTRPLRLRLRTRHHVANRGRVPLPAARRTDPARVQGLGDLPQ
jgi:hypothetical protein